MGLLRNLYMKTKDEDELREIEDDMNSQLEDMDYDSDEYTKLDLKRIDYVNEISSRCADELPKSEHGWYLPEDDD